MGKINLGRVFGSGVLTGSVALTIGVLILIFNLWMGKFDNALPVLGRPLPGPWPAFMMLGLYLVMGVAVIWLYASIRPTYGAGAKTAAMAGLAFWFAVSLAEVYLSLMGLFPLRMLVRPACILLLGIVVGAELGAACYREGESGKPS